ncbi:hypothetical protein B0G81_1749 [Paraburkholderia sp. BL6665CI2N2]|nr:hypothetical protein B0G81_1749 [Paraburkholderia sp. BL6665CI2N2]
MQLDYKGFDINASPLERRVELRGTVSNAVDWYVMDGVLRSDSAFRNAVSSACAAFIDACASLTSFVACAGRPLNIASRACWMSSNA